MDFANEPVEILERAEFRRDILVPATIHSLPTVANCVGNARLAGLAGGGVVSPLAVRLADRMDRRKINHIESHRLRVIDAAEAIAEGRARVGFPLRRAREKFIPRRKGCPLAVHPHGMKRLGGCGNRAVGVNRHERAKIGVVRQSVGLVRIGGAHFLRELFQRLAVRSLPRTLGGGLDESRTFQNLALQLAQPGGEFFFQFVLPGEKHIPPRLDREFPRARACNQKLPGPAVVEERTHRRFIPSGLTRTTPFQKGRHLVMAVLENIGLDFERSAHRPLHGETGIVERGSDSANDDGFGAFGHVSSSSFCTSGSSPSRPEATLRSERSATGTWVRNSDRPFCSPKNP